MEDEAFFYLLQSYDDKGEKIFAMWLKCNSCQIPPTITYKPEYALRVLTEAEILEYQRCIKEFGNWVSKFDFKVVKYWMKKAQLSWSPPIGYEFKEYKDYYEKQES